MATVLVTGGNGFIGRKLCMQLHHKGYNVAIFSRTKNSKSTFPIYTWDPEKMEIEEDGIDKADYIIHLAGENIGDKRWTGKRKQQIVDSRVKTGFLMYNKVRERNKKLQAFISASAIGYYGALTSDKIFTETDLSSNDFLGETCKQWEQSADNFAESGIRTIKIRTGIVLSGQGGVLSKLIALVKSGFGSAIGDGKQYMPWIHIDDLCGIYIKAIEDVHMEGIYNAVAPDHITNKEFMQTLAQVYKRPFWFPDIPGWFLKLLFGEMSGMLLKGSRVSSEKLVEVGYHFLYPDLKSALCNFKRG